MSTVPTVSSVAAVSALTEATKRIGFLCGWLIALFIGAMCVYMGVWAFVARVTPSMRVYSYAEARCTIRFIRQIGPLHHSFFATHSRYVVIFSFTMQTANNQEYQIAGTSIGSSFMADGTELQEFASDYHAGSVYPCWYNPTNPLHVVFYRGLPIFPFVFCSSFTAFGLFILLKLLPGGVRLLFLLLWESALCLRSRRRVRKVRRVAIPAHLE